MNWGNLRIPNEATDVTIPDDCSNPCVIDSGDVYHNEAECRDLLIENDPTLQRYFQLNMDSSKLYMYGDLTINGDFRHTLGIIEMRAAIEQTISGANAPTFYNFRMFNTAATGGVTLSAVDITVSKKLTFTDGIITTGANKVIMSNATLDGLNGISGGSNASFVYGNLRQQIASNNSVYVFPLGNSNTSTGYHRLDLVNNFLTGTTYIDASVAAIINSGNDIDANLAVSQGSDALGDLLESSVWTLNPNVQPGGGTYGVRLYVENVTGLSSTDDNVFYALKRPDASTTFADWTNVNADASVTTIPGSGLAGRVYNSGNGYAERLGWKAFSKHAIAKKTLLPIQLLYFDAVRDEKIVNLDWSTASEKNNNFFTIERSLDANNFEFVSNFPGAGNSIVTLNYTSTDFTPYSEKSYYRLTQTDFDGTQSYSKIVAVGAINENEYSDVNIIKVQNAIQIEIENISNDDYFVEIVDMLGRVMFKEKYTSPSNKIMIDINSNKYAKGIYNVAVFNANTVKTSKIIVE